MVAGCGPTPLIRLKEDCAVLYSRIAATTNHCVLPTVATASLQPPIPAAAPSYGRTHYSYHTLTATLTLPAHQLVKEKSPGLLRRLYLSQSSCFNTSLLSTRILYLARQVSSIVMDNMSTASHTHLLDDEALSRASHSFSSSSSPIPSISLSPVLYWTLLHLFAR